MDDIASKLGLFVHLADFFKDFEKTLIYPIAFILLHDFV